MSSPTSFSIVETLSSVAARGKACSMVQAVSILADGRTISFAPNHTDRLMPLAYLPGSVVKINVNLLEILYAEQKVEFTTKIILDQPCLAMQPTQCPFKLLSDELKFQKSSSTFASRLRKKLPNYQSAMLSIKDTQRKSVTVAQKDNTDSERESTTSSSKHESGNSIPFIGSVRRLIRTKEPSIYEIIGEWEQSAEQMGGLLIKSGVHPSIVQVMIKSRCLAEDAYGAFYLIQGPKGIFYLESFRPLWRAN